MTRSHAIRIRAALAAVAASAVTSAVVVGVAAGPASAAETLSCGSVVTSSVVLQNDITGCPGNGLVIGASGIVIDLNHHLISGTGYASSNGNGIDGEGSPRSDVVIKNGRIQNFLSGVLLSDGVSNTQVTGLQLTANREGVNVSFGTHDVIADNFLSGTPDVGGAGISVYGGDRHVVESNTVKAFRRVGIYVASPSPKIAGNHVSDSGIGILVSSQNAQVLSNTAVSNTQWGIYTNPSTGSIIGNTASQNGSHGIHVSVGAGTVSVGSNIANYNGGRGIDGSSGVIDGGNNRAVGNQVSPRCTYVHC